MVHINAVKELGTVGVKAEKGLLIVGNPVGAVVVIVLVEIGDKVVVLIPPGKDADIATGKAATAPVGIAVLVVVVVDVFVQLQVVSVIYNARFLHGAKRRGVFRIGLK